MQLDLSADHLCWDQTEPVTLERVKRAGGPSREYVGVAKRSAIRSAEKSPSGGAYAGYEVSWRVPARLLQGGALKPGDVVERGDGTRDTILKADLIVLGSRWALGCVDLVLANDLCHQVDIERANIDYSASGAPRKRFPPEGGLALVSALPARVQLLTDELADERGLRSFNGKYAVICDRQLDAFSVTVEDRVKWTDERGKVVYLDILGLHNPERIDELPVLDCEARS